MESLASNVSYHGNPQQLRNAVGAKPASAPDALSVNNAAARDRSTPDPSAIPSEESQAQASPYQARLSYDRDKGSVFVEIVDAATGDVVQQLPADTAADHLQSLTGRRGGTIADKIA